VLECVWGLLFRLRFCPSCLSLPNENLFQEKKQCFAYCIFYDTPRLLPEIRFCLRELCEGVCVCVCVLVHNARQHKQRNRDQISHVPLFWDGGCGIGLGGKHRPPRNLFSLFSGWSGEMGRVCVWVWEGLWCFFKLPE
jgi:hypothetical protein